MTKARDLANIAGAITNNKIPSSKLDVSFENISDTGNTGTKVSVGTTAQRGSTTGQFRFNSTTGKFEGKNSSGFIALETNPIVSSVNVSSITQKQINDGFDLVITGENFNSGDTAKFIGNDNTEFTAPTTTVNSATQITARITSNIDATKEPYKVQVSSSAGLIGSLASAFNIDAAPVWTTAAGNIGSVEEGNSTNITIAASDAEGDSITYAETGGTILSGAGFSLNSSTGAITGTAPSVSGSATYTFNARATSGTNFTDRTFNIVVADAPTGGTTGTYSHGGTTYTFHKFTTNSNFVIGATKTVDIFMIGGGGGTGGDNSGGGGAGGLIWRPSLSLTAGTYAVVVGNGGNGVAAGSQITGNAKGNNSTFGTLLTALGGGYGGDSSITTRGEGGSGGGGGRYGNTGFDAKQTSDTSISADSRTYGFGFDGGNGNSGSEGPGGGGGGTGAVGVNASSGTVGNGGVGNSTFISSSSTQTTAFLLGTTSGTNSSNAATTGSSSGTLYIGGGGSGGTQNRGSHGSGGSGGLGGGASIGNSSNGNAGMTNTGSGGSSTTSGTGSGGAGGSGLVIVRYS